MTPYSDPVEVDRGNQTAVASRNRPPTWASWDDMEHSGVREALRLGSTPWMLVSFTAIAVWLVLQTSCRDRAPSAPQRGPEARREAGSVAFDWNDLALPIGDFDADLARCKSSIEDPWAARQPAFNRAILEFGCMQKRGWRRVQTDAGAELP